jgi:hypothetical protein
MFPNNILFSKNENYGNSIEDGVDVMTCTVQNCRVRFLGYTTSISFHWILTIFLFCIFCCVPCFGEELSPDDVIDAYHYHQSQFLGSRVLFGYSKKLHADFFGKSHETKDEYSTQMQGCIDYWTDSTNFLVREIDVDLNNFDHITLIDSNLFHLNNFTASDLETTYRHLRISSYFAKENLTRIWQGFPSKDKEQSQQRGSAFIDSSNLIIKTPILSPPYLPYGNSENEGIIFPSDYFFSLPREGMSIIGHTKINGAKYIIMEHQTMYDDTNLFDNPEMMPPHISKIGHCVIYRAWVDPAKGFLPIRIEWWGNIETINDKLTKDKTSTDFQKESAYVFEINTIQECGNGFFYPTEATQNFYAAKIMPEETINIPLNVVTGEKDTEHRPSVIYCKKKWKIFHVERNVDIASTTLDLPFPKGTGVFDGRTKKLGVAGMTDAEYEAQIKAEEQKSRAKYNFDSGYVLPDPNAKRKIEDYIPRAPDGYRSAFFIIGVNLIVLSLLARYFFRCWKEYKNNKNNQSKK